MRSLLPFAAASLILACSSSESPAPDQNTATGGANGTGGSSATGGAATGGSTGGSATATGTGGAAPVTGGVSATGGASTGGAPATGGTSATGGTPATGGATNAGGAAVGGGGSSAGGAAAGSGGSGGSDESSVAKALNGLRVDAPCEGMPPTTDGSVCTHTVLMNNTFKATKDATLAGASGATYDVKLRIRGVVEPTSVSGGMRPDTSTFSYKNEMWRKLPYTIGGTVSAPDYQAWSIRVESPKQDYFLNDYQKTAHNVFKLDYELTIQVAAGSKVTLDVTDANERQIDNYEKYELEGLAGSMNFGQFVQIDVVSVTQR